MPSYLFHTQTLSGTCKFIRFCEKKSIQWITYLSLFSPLFSSLLLPSTANFSYNWQCHPCYLLFYLYHFLHPICFSLIYIYFSPSLLWQCFISFLVPLTALIFMLNWILMLDIIHLKNDNYFTKPVY